MKTFKLFMLLACMCMLSYTAMSQYTFTIKFSITGRCFDGLSSNLRHEAESLVNNALAQTGAYPLTKEECEALNRLITSEAMSISSSGGGCNIKWTISRCTGKEPFGGKDIILGPQQGSSFYSTNPANEVADWVNDDIERQLALNKDNLNEKESSEFSNAKNGLRKNDSWFLDDKKPFVPVNMRQGGFSETSSEDLSMKSKIDKSTDFSYLANQANVNRYFNASTRLAVPYLANPQDLTLLLHQEFRLVSGFDLDAIMQKLPSQRTPAEKQALYDYQEWRKQVLSQMLCDIDNTKEKIEIDAAILANDVYGTDEMGYINHTNYKKVVMSDVPKDNPMRGVAEAIMECNKTINSSTGFHAEIYYNEKNDKWVIAIAGSDDSEDWINNGANLLGAEVPQYNLAMAIASSLNSIPKTVMEKLNIEIVGHSLGGGVASVIGMATGLNTMTFNAARVPESFIKENGLDAKNVDHITAYHTSTDILTNIQQIAKTPAIGISVDIGDPLTPSEKAQVRATGAKIGGAAAFATSVLPGNALINSFEGAKEGAELWEMKEGHKMSPMVRSIENRHMDKVQSKWNEINRSINSVERQTQETMMIITGD